MRPGSDLMAQLLSSSFTLSFEADLFYGNERVLANLPVVSPSIVFDSSAQVEGSGRMSVVWSADDGSSVAPEDATSLLAPFGARISLYAVVSSAPFSARQKVGEFDITEVPSVGGEPYFWGETLIQVGERVDLVVKDRMVEVQRDRFTGLQEPSQLTSVYQELAFLTGLPITRTLEDGPISRSVVYEESRVDAVQDLAALIGGVAFMEWDGTLSVRPIAAGDPVAELTLGEDGTIVQVGSSLSADGVYNGVVIRGETSDQEEILAELWVTEGPLRATQIGGERTPFHRVPRFYSSPFISTTAQAQAAAPGLLAEFSNPRATTLEVTCVNNPLLQIGDVVIVRDRKWVWTVRLTKVPVVQAATITVTGDVLSRDLVEYARFSGFGEGFYGLDPEYGE